MSSTILVVDDQMVSRTHVANRLEDAGFSVIQAGDGDEGWESFCRHHPSLVVTDLRMPRSDGIELLGRVRAQSDVPVILLTAYGDIATAVKAIKGGAEEFLSFDDLDMDRLVDRVQELLGGDVMECDFERLRELWVGESPSAQRVRERIAGLCPMEVPVLICGESGSGRSLVARCLHETGPRAAKPFVEIRCSEAKLDDAVPSEGTIYLDEIGQLAPEVQVRWLEVIRKSTEGSDRGLRVVASTSDDLYLLTRESSFDHELAEAIGRFKIQIPALRERPEDLDPIAEVLLRRIAKRIGRRQPSVSSSALVRLHEHPWPGNARELAEVLEKVIAFSSKGEITRSQVDDVLEELSDSVSSLREQRRQHERQMLIDVLREAGGNLTKAADMLGKSRGAVRHQAKKYGLL